MDSTQTPLAPTPPRRTGTTLIDLGGSVEFGAAVALRTDGGILIAGNARTAGSELIDFCLVRLLADGALDPSFGNAGVSLLPVVNGSDDVGRALAALPGGGILVAGSSYDPGSGGYDYTAVALTAAGARLPGFGTAGAVRVGTGASVSDQLRATLVQPDGRILLVGDGYNPATATQDIGVVRLTAAGAPDPAFGVAGVALLETPTAWETVGGAVLQPDGKLLIAGSRQVGTGYDLTLARLGGDGRIDAAFGQAGSVAIDLAGDSGDRNGVVALQRDPVGGGSRILLAGTAYDSARNRTTFAVVRLDQAGAVDTGFGSGGKTFVDVGSGALNLAGIAVDPDDGGILIVGDRYDAFTASRDVVVVRLAADGRPDSGFGDAGVASIPIRGNDSARGFTLLADGGLMVVGNGSDGAVDGIRVLKLGPDGQPDPAFGDVLVIPPIVGSSAGERLVGTAYDETISGMAGNDTLTGAGGDDTLDGGEGTDVAVLSGALSGYRLSRSGASLTVTDLTARRDGMDTATGIERLQFADMSVNLNVQSVASSIPQSTLDRICELYVGFFGRVPAANGLENWVNQHKGGKTLDQIAGDFYGIGASAQLRTYTRYWDFTLNRELSDADYVKIVYRNVLGREGLQTGVDYWAGQLTGAGAKTRGELVSTMLDAAHGLKTSADWGWVANLLDDRITMSKRVAMEWGLNYASTDQQAIEKGIAIAGAVDSSPNPNPDPVIAAIPVKTFDFVAATELVGVNPALIDLIA